jgi:protein TonB
MRTLAMPIRFRCAYCNQLMGIARRKAGTVVSCPTCHGQVVVPMPESPLIPVPAPSPPAPPVPLEKPRANVFERQDFDPGLFNPNPVPAPLPVPREPVNPPTAPMPPTGGFDVQPVFLPPAPASAPVPAPAPPKPPAGPKLTTRQMVLLAVGAVVLAGVAFGAGFAVGKWM